MKFRKKPVVIDAVQVTDAWFDGDHPNDLHIIGLVNDPRRRVVEIPTLEGTMTAQVGDWIITGVKGERYPCKPDIFEATYEPVPALPRDSSEAEGKECQAVISCPCPVIHHGDCLKTICGHVLPCPDHAALAPLAKEAGEKSCKSCGGMGFYVIVAGDTERNETCPDCSGSGNATPSEPRKPCLDPDKMKGAGDEFGGEDFPSEPRKEDRRGN